MKREAIAALFLLMLILMAIGNIALIHRWTDEIRVPLELCAQEAVKEAFPVSRQHWEKAYALWQSRQRYAALVLPHGEIDSIQDAFFQLQEFLLQEDPAAAAAAERLLLRLSSAEAMESLSMGAIF